MSGPFDDDVVTAIAGYMNANQADANLLIVQVHGAQPAATDCVLVDVGGESATFRASVGGGDREVVVPWSRPIARREHIQRELMELYETALEH